MLRALVDEIAVGARARVRTARAQATTLEAFVADGFRAYFAFLAQDPQTCRVMRRNAGTIRTLFDEPALGAGIVELREDLDAGDRRRHAARRTTPGSWPPRWSGPPSRSAWRWSPASTIDADASAAFVTSVFVGAFLHMR